MKEIIKKIKLAAPRNMSDYVRIYKEIDKKTGQSRIKDVKELKVAILSSFTVNGIKEILAVKSWKIGLHPNIYIGEYNQYAQDILDSGSKLYKFLPDIIFLFIDTRQILGDYYFEPYKLKRQGRRKLIDEKFLEINNLLQELKNNVKAKIVIHNFEVPSFSPLGILENKQDFGFQESVENLNQKLQTTYKKDKQIFVYNYDQFCSKTGKSLVMNNKMYYMGDIKIDFNLFPLLCDEYFSYIKPLYSKNRKCIVLDLDNTLWGGAVGEDGIEGIKLGPTPAGRPFWEFQKYILSLYRRGIILAINSKNNPEDVEEVFKKHPYMVLKKKYFAAIETNWNDKATNMKRIAQHINIGLDSMVFFDDDEFNCEIIREALPEVKVVSMSQDAADYLETVQGLNDFNTMQITSEDKKKGEMYAQQWERREIENSSINIDDYLKKLKLVLSIEKANKFNIPRLAQLTQKTNQFNMTTHRYQEEDIKNFQKNNYLIYGVNVNDKFGDNGIVATIIIERSNDNWRLDTFLLSCRVIGRRVEDVIMKYIIDKAKKEKVKYEIGEIIPTTKYQPANVFLKNINFILKDKEGNREIWEYDTKNIFPKVDFIKIK